VNLLEQLKNCFETTLDDAHVINDGETKSLFFDMRNVQSSMRIDNPNELAFGYTRTMMGALLFQQEPKDILIVGLGGGSLSKYCYHQLPECTVTTVELSETVINLRDEFAIPEDNERFHIIHADAANYMQHQIESADIILLDGFSPAGLPDELITQTFYNHCFRALRPGGVLSANLWGTDKRLQACLSRLNYSFKSQLLQAKSPAGNNDIVFGLKQFEQPTWINLQLRARHLQRETDINFVDLLSQLRRSALDHNNEFWLIAEDNTE
jgi:spermidine synthase